MLTTSTSQTRLAVNWPLPNIYCFTQVHNNTQLFYLCSNHFTFLLSSSSEVWMARLFLSRTSPTSDKSLLAIASWLLVREEDRTSLFSLSSVAIRLSIRDTNTRNIKLKSIKQTAVTTKTNGDDWRPAEDRETMMRQISKANNYELRWWFNYEFITSACLDSLIGFKLQIPLACERRRISGCRLSPLKTRDGPLEKWSGEGRIWDFFSLQNCFHVNCLCRIPFSGASPLHEGRGTGRGKGGLREREMFCYRNLNLDTRHNLNMLQVQTNTF